MLSLITRLAQEVVHGSGFPCCRIMLSLSWSLVDRASGSHLMLIETCERGDSGSGQRRGRLVNATLA